LRHEVRFQRYQAAVARLGDVSPLLSGAAIDLAAHYSEDSE
jgi:hypothetical protein